MKNAIFMLCILNESYVLGSCISGYMHNNYKKKYNLDFDIVLMVDEFIYNNYFNILKNYFDKVLKIKLIEFDISNKYEYAKKKYSSWINYSLNKWKCLKYDEYDKILFIDVDILPYNLKFYDLFNFNTPAFNHLSYIKKDNDKYHLNRDFSNCENNSKKNINFKVSFSNYINDFFKYGTLNGGILLLKPDIKEYKEYKLFTSKLFKNGIFSHHQSGPDETSLFYFYSKKLKYYYNICNDYCIVPWDNPDIKDYSNINSINYLSFVKPWIKPKFLMWNEEFVWNTILKNMNNTDLFRLKNNQIRKVLKFFNKLDYFKQKKYFNIYFVKKYDINFKDDETDENIKNLENKVNIKDYGLLNIKNFILE